VRTPQFYRLWIILFLNVTAGIGIIEQAAPMIQEMFVGLVTASAAAGFVGLLSLFNMSGRFFWSSMSDKLGRKGTYGIFFVAGPLLYLALPQAGQAGSVTAFVICCAIILSMYGGGFALAPAYLSDMFGTQYVGAIHGRLLTAWSAAGVAGPLLVNKIRGAQIAAGMAPRDAYTLTLYVMAGLLAVGFFANLGVKPVDPTYHMTADELALARSPEASH
jgi:MFS family permease